MTLVLHFIQSLAASVAHLVSLSNFAGRVSCGWLNTSINNVLTSNLVCLEQGVLMVGLLWKTGPVDMRPYAIRVKQRKSAKKHKTGGRDRRSKACGRHV
jgi:hypothetical protein